MTFFEFLSDSPYLSFFLWFTLAMLINRPLRHMNIRKHGWPPAHCDADGNFKDED